MKMKIKLRIKWIQRNEWGRNNVFQFPNRNKILSAEMYADSSLHMTPSPTLKYETVAHVEWVPLLFEKAASAFVVFGSELQLSGGFLRCPVSIISLFEAFSNP